MSEESESSAVLLQKRRREEEDQCNPDNLANIDPVLRERFLKAR